MSNQELGAHARARSAARSYLSRGSVEIGRWVLPRKTILSNYIKNPGVLQKWGQPHACA